MALTLSDFQGRRIDFLGSNQTVLLTGVANFPIFTTSTVANRSGIHLTHIAFVTIDYPTGIAPAGAVFNFGTNSATFNNWASGLTLTNYAAPAVIYCPDQIAPFPDGAAFTMRVTTGQAQLVGNFTVSAWGFAE